MKSKKAEEYINNEKHEDYLGGYLCYQLSDEKAKKAVEIAEEEMREKATDSFCKTVCGGREKFGSCESCTLIKTFENEYDN